MIKKLLESMEESKKSLPKAYWPIEEVTQIHYGFNGRKTITVDEIKNYKNTL